MNQEEFRNRISQIAIWSRDEIDQVQIKQVIASEHMCQYCHERPTHGRATISAGIDTVTRQRVWRIYCKTCNRNLDPHTHQPVASAAIQLLPKPDIKRGRGRPRKDPNP